MNNLQESMLDAMQVFIKDSTAKLNFPLTLECEIVKCTDEDKGEYEVNYLDNHFLAYCQYKGYKYNEGEVVYVLIPKGDFSKTKVILGIEKDGLIDSSVPIGSFVEDVKVDGISVVTDSVANINNMATKDDISTLQRNFQAGVDAIGDACERKGSIPASSSLEDTVAAIDAIQTGGNYMTKEIREDGEYHASDDGVDAYDIVIVSKDVGQPHTVVFYDIDGVTILKTQVNVPYHGNASCTSLDGKTFNGLYFKGWNPQPINIVRDTFCYPQFGDYVIEPGEIEDDWQTICANAGANYPLGSRKALVISSTESENCIFEDYLGNEHTQRFTTNFQMVKVGEGEDSSTSTWLATGAIYLDPNDYFKSITPSGNWNGYQYATTYGVHNSDHTKLGWKCSDMRHFLNQVFLRNLPLPLFENIKAVTKYSRDRIADNSGTLNNDMETFDKIWLPSEREMRTVVIAANGSMAYTPVHMGIDYSAVYAGTYGYGFATRDCLSWIENEIKYGSNFARMDRYWFWGNDASFVIGFCL